MTTWQEKLCKQVCDLIPGRFKNIHIIHSDILHGVDESKKDGIFAEFLSKVEKDETIDPRIRSSTFQIEPLDFDNISKLSEPYIIIDQAHMFKYLKDEFTTDKNTKIEIEGVYKETDKGKKMTLNVIYLGKLLVA